MRPATAGCTEPQPSCNPHLRERFQCYPPNWVGISPLRGPSLPSWYVSCRGSGPARATRPGSRTRSGRPVVRILQAAAWRTRSRPRTSPPRRFMLLSASPGAGGRASRLREVPQVVPAALGQLGVERCQVGRCLLVVPHATRRRPATAGWHRSRPPTSGRPPGRTARFLPALGLRRLVGVMVCWGSRPRPRRRRPSRKSAP